MAKNGYPQFLQPSSSIPQWSGIGVVVLLAGSLVALLLAPTLMPEPYSWLTHTTSESAAQGLEGAWLARLGFLLLGLAVLWLAIAAAKEWARGAVWMHLAFGVFMLSTAAFSHRPFIEGVPFDPVEDLLHSIAATGMGFAFSFGVLARFFQRHPKNSFAGMLDLVAVAASVVLPLLMAAQPAWTGLFQRLMFLVAYIWYGLEALSLPRGV